MQFTVGPTKSDSDVILCLHRHQGLRINRSLFINPIRRKGLINKRPFDSRLLKGSVHDSVKRAIINNIRHCHFWLALQ